MSKRTIIGRVLDRLLSSIRVDFDAVLERGDPRSRVSRGLYVGRRPTADAVPELRRAGITHVVSCLDVNERSSVAFLADDFDHLFVGARDSVHEDLAVHFDEVIEFAGVEPSDSRQVLIHCEAGVSRSVALAIALMMRRRPQPFYEAYGAIKACRREARPNPGFATQLQRLERELLGDGSPSAPSSLARYLHEVCGVPADVELIQSMLDRHDDDAIGALHTLFDGEIPRVVQGMTR